MNPNEENDSYETKQQAELASVLEYAEQRAKIKQEALEAYKSALDDSDELNREDENYKKASAAKRKSQQDYILQPQEIRKLIQLKKDKDPNRPLNCEVFDRTQSIELKNHLESLISHSEKHNDKRFQIILESKEKHGIDFHWSTADIHIKNNAISIIHFDTITVGLNPQMGGTNNIEIERALNSITTDKEIILNDAYFCNPKNNSKIDMQADGESCSIYATSIALAMSKIPNLHEIAVDHSTPKQYASLNKNNIKENYVEAIYFPATILKNTQNIAAIDIYDDLHKRNEINKIVKGEKSMTLKEFTSYRTHQSTSAGREKIMNHSILFSRAHYKKAVDEAATEKEKDQDKTIAATDLQAPKPGTST